MTTTQNITAGTHYTVGTSKVVHVAGYADQVRLSSHCGRYTAPANITTTTDAATCRTCANRAARAAIAAARTN